MKSTLAQREHGKIDKVLAQLLRTRRRLTADQNRIARRKARRLFVGALRSARHALDVQYPAIGKPEKPHRSKPANLKKPLLPFNRSWNIDAARLYMRVACEQVNRHAPTIKAHEGARSGKDCFAGEVYFRPSWTSRKKWSQLLHWICFFGQVSPIDAYDVWRRFWSEQIPVTDLPLAAEHQAFIEKQQKKSEAAHRALSARKAERRAT